MEHIKSAAEQVRLRLIEKLNSSTTPSDTAPSTECAVCGDTGWLRLDGPDRRVARCQCRAEKVIQSRIAAIPHRFRACSFSSYIPGTPQQERAVNAMSADFTKSFFLHGSYGHGKTHLLTAQYVQIVYIEQPCLMLTMAELVMELRKAELEPDYYCTVRERARHAERFHLFVDDIDKFKVTDFKFEVLFDLFDTMYKRNLGLTLTSNFSLRELVVSDRLHGSIVRRIEDVCQVLEV